MKKKMSKEFFFLKFTVHHGPRVKKQRSTERSTGAKNGPRGKKTTVHGIREGQNPNSTMFATYVHKDSGLRAQRSKHLHFPLFCTHAHTASCMALEIARGLPRVGVRVCTSPALHAHVRSRPKPQTLANTFCTRARFGERAPSGSLEPLVAGREYTTPRNQIIVMPVGRWNLFCPPPGHHA